MKKNNSINYRLRHENAVASDFRRGIDKQNQEWLDGTLGVDGNFMVKIKDVNFYKDLSKKDLYKDSDLKHLIMVNDKDYENAMKEYEEVVKYIWGE